MLNSGVQAIEKLHNDMDIRQANRVFDGDCTLVIDRRAIHHNLAQIRRQTRRRIIAVIKENGYGIGLYNAYSLLREGGVNFFAVSSYEEAMALRDFGCREEILLLTPVLSRAECTALVKRNVILMLGDMAQLYPLACAAMASGLSPRVHLKIETGLGRYGFVQNELPRLADSLRSLAVEGCYTHLSGGTGYKKTVERQYCAFIQALEYLIDKGVNTGMKHISNSRATLTFGSLGFDAVRVGSALLGKCPGHPSLKEGVWLESSIRMTKTCPKGVNIGYGGGAKLIRDSVLGVVPCGHSDGVFIGNSQPSLLRRMLGRQENSCAYVGKCRLPLIGKAGASHMTLDLTDSDCGVGDTVRIPINPLMVQSHIERRVR